MMVKWYQDEKAAMRAAAREGQKVHVEFADEDQGGMPVACHVTSMSPDAISDYYRSGGQWGYYWPREYEGWE